MSEEEHDFPVETDDSGFHFSGDPHDIPFPGYDVDARLEKSGRTWIWVIDSCPYCGRQHRHGGGLIGDDPHRLLGHRAAHCTEGAAGYFLFPLEEIGKRYDLITRTRKGRSMNDIPWTRKPVLFFCPACRRWIDDSFVTSDQVHDRTRGGCGEFVLTRADARMERKAAASIA
jgi:hypothetical protein